MGIEYLSPPLSSVMSPSLRLWAAVFPSVSLRGLPEHRVALDFDLQEIVPAGEIIASANYLWPWALVLPVVS